jgi:hypothetical protein
MNPGIDQGFDQFSVCHIETSEKNEQRPFVASPSDRALPN